MKHAKWFGSALLTLVTALAVPGATAFTLENSNLQTFLASSAVEYQTTAYGAFGGNTTANSNDSSAEAVGEDGSGHGSVEVTGVTIASEASGFSLIGLPLLGYALFRRKKRVSE